MDAFSIYRRVSPHFRRQRMRRFVAMLSVTERTTILDVGGSWDNWSLLDFRPRVIRLNLDQHHADVIGDGCALPFADRSFDVVFSNSVIEHVEHPDAFAREIRRVGRSYWVQAPDFWFPIEPHLIGPFIHWLPARLRPFAARWGTLRGWLNAADVPTILGEVRLPTTDDMRGWFPDAALLRERMAGWPKSIMATDASVPLSWWPMLRRDLHRWFGR